MRERAEKRGQFVFILTFLLLLSGPAWASIASLPVVRIEWGDSGFWDKSYSFNELTPSANGSFAFSGNLSGPEIQATWSVEFKSDPFLMVGINTINPTDEVQTYNYLFVVPVDPITGLTAYYGGSIGGSLTTDPEGGSLSTVDPDPLYQGMIDGEGELYLYEHESSWSKDRQGTTTIPAVEAGLPPSLPYYDNDVDDSIGLRIQFDLTPGDTAGLTAYFEVIPEPATLALLGLGGMVILGRKRRELIPAAPGTLISGGMLTRAWAQHK
jgi:hypothetical protein